MYAKYSPEDSKGKKKMGQLNLQKVKRFLEK